MQNNIIKILITAAVLLITLLSFSLIYFLFKRNNMIKLVEKIVKEINNLDSQIEIEIENEYKFNVNVYDLSLFSMTKVKDISVKSYELLSKTILITDVLNFKKIYLNDAFVPKSETIIIGGGLLKTSDNEYPLKEIVYLKGYLEPWKNSFFVEFVFYTKNKSLLIQILNYNDLVIIDNYIKNNRLR